MGLSEEAKRVAEKNGIPSELRGAAATTYVFCSLIPFFLFKCALYKIREEDPNDDFVTVFFVSTFNIHGAISYAISSITTFIEKAKWTANWHILGFRELVFLPSENNNPATLCIVLNGAVTTSLGQYIRELDAKRERMVESQVRCIFQQTVIALAHVYDVTAKASGDARDLLAYVNFDLFTDVMLCIYGTTADTASFIMTKLNWTPVHSIRTESLQCETDPDMSRPSRLIHAPEIYASSSYYAPELVIMWRLGIMLFVMLYNRYPFANKDKYMDFIDGDDAALEFPPDDDASSSPGATSLVKRLLKRKPEERMTMQDLLQHPWFLTGLPAGLKSASYEFKECSAEIVAAARDALARFAQSVDEIESIAKCTSFEELIADLIAKDV